MTEFQTPKLKYFLRYLAVMISFCVVVLFQIKEHNSRKWDNSDKKKYGSDIFFLEEYIYEISEP